MPNADTSTKSSRAKKDSTKKRAPAKGAGTTGSTTPVEVLPAAVTDEVIDQLVTTLNGWERSAGFEFARRVGGLIIETFYGGDVNAWRSRAEKDASFRKLKARADEGTLRVSTAALYRSVALVELEARVGPVDKAHLTMTHVREVFGLPAEQQQRLLTAAEEKGWSIEKMETEAAKVRKKEGDGRGRPPLPGFVKGINALGRLIEPGDGKADPFSDLDQVEDLSAEEAEALWKTVVGVKLKCEELQKKLATKVPGWEPNE